MKLISWGTQRFHLHRQWIKSFNAKRQENLFDLHRQENLFGNSITFAWGCRIKSFQRQKAKKAFWQPNELSQFWSPKARKSIWQPYEVGLRLPHPTADTQGSTLDSCWTSPGFTITCKIIFWQTNITTSSVLLQTTDGQFQLLDARKLLTKQLI